MPHVAPVILPQLLKLIAEPAVYSVRTRSRAVHIFNTISNFIYNMSYTFPVSQCYGMGRAKIDGIHDEKRVRISYYNESRQ